MTYDRRNAAQFDRVYLEMAELFLKGSGYPPAQIKGWRRDMATALKKSLVGNRAVSEVLHNISLEDAEEGRYEQHARYARG